MTRNNFQMAENWLNGWELVEKPIWPASGPELQKGRINHKWSGPGQKLDGGFEPVEVDLGWICVGFADSNPNLIASWIRIEATLAGWVLEIGSAEKVRLDW